MFYQAIKIAICMSFPLYLGAQNQLTLDDLVKESLTNNYNVQLATKSEQAARTQTTKGIAGFFPVVSIGGSYSFSSMGTETEFAGNIPNVSNPAAISQSYNAGLNIDYMIFEGFKPRYTLKQLNLQADALGLNKQQTMEVTAYNVGLVYYQLLGLQNSINIAQEQLDLTKVQIKRIETARKYGQGNESTRLNLLTSFNMDSTQLLQLQQSLAQGKQELNKLLGKSIVGEASQLAASEENTDLLVLEDLKTVALQQNKAIRLAKLQRVQADNSLKLLKTDLYPKLSTRLSYGVGGQINEVGIVQNNLAFGPTATLNLSYTIYSGGRLKPTFNKAKIDIEQAEVQLAATEYDLEQSLELAFKQYQYTLSLLPVEKQNVNLSEQNLQRIQKQFELGQSTFLDFQQAQLNVVRAKQQFYQASLGVKRAVWDLYYLSGQLLK